MTPLRRRFVLFGLLFLGVLAIGSQVNLIWARENRIVFLLPDSPIRRVKLELLDKNEELVRSAELFPRPDHRGQLVYVVDVPEGPYRLDVDYEFRPTAHGKKSRQVDWTRMGVQHQIRLEGEEYRFPPPEETK